MGEGWNGRLDWAVSLLRALLGGEPAPRPPRLPPPPPRNVLHTGHRPTLCLLPPFPSLPLLSFSPSPPLPTLPPFLTLQ
eukprot:3565822-Rhodomonas_salina.1